MDQPIDNSAIEDDMFKFLLQKCPKTWVNAPLEEASKVMVLSSIITGNQQEKVNLKFCKNFNIFTSLSFSWLW